MTAKQSRRKSAARRVRPTAADLLAPHARLGEVAARLALAAPDAPAPAPRVREQLLARARAARLPMLLPPLPVAPGWRFELANAADGWRPATFPGVRFKTLSADAARDVVMLLIELAPGAHFPDHAHDAGPDEGIVISGEVTTGGLLLRAGDYYHAAAGTSHTDIVSPGGCRALVTLTARAWKRWREGDTSP